MWEYLTRVVRPIGDPIALTLGPIIYKSLVGFLKYWELEIIRERILFKICYRSSNKIDHKNLCTQKFSEFPEMIYDRNGH